MKWNNKLLELKFPVRSCLNLPPTTSLISGLDTIRHGSNTSSTIKLQADVVVAGAGLAGLSVAHHLAKKGVNVYVFDRDW